MVLIPPYGVLVQLYPAISKILISQYFQDPLLKLILIKQAPTATTMAPTTRLLGAIIIAPTMHNPPPIHIYLSDFFIASSNIYLPHLTADFSMCQPSGSNLNIQQIKNIKRPLFFSRLQIPEDTGYQKISFLSFNFKSFEHLLNHCPVFRPESMKGLFHIIITHTEYRQAALCSFDIL